jgi:hypothetical protein
MCLGRARPFCLGAAGFEPTALGRQEEWEDSPEGYPQTPTGRWLNYHDAYGEEATGSQAGSSGA